MNNENLTLSIAEKFSKTPGARYRAEGKFSGEEFREDVLKPAFEKARAEKKKLVIILDGVDGYATSFLEEAFGGLAREFGADLVLTTLDFVSTEEEYLKSDIHEYIENTRGNGH